MPPTLARGSYTYVTHASVIATFQSRMEDLVDEIVTADSSGSWSRTYSGIYQVNYAMVVGTHTDGAQICLLAGENNTLWSNLQAPGSVFGAPAAGLNDRIYMAYKPSCSGASFDTGDDPINNGTWFEDAGSFFAVLCQIAHDVIGANRRFDWYVDTTSASLLLRYDEAPGTMDGLTLFSDHGDGSMLAADSMQVGDAHGEFVACWGDAGASAFRPIKNAWNPVFILSADSRGAFVDGYLTDNNIDMSANDAVQAAAIDTAQPWTPIEGSLYLATHGRKGRISSDWVSWLRDGAVGNETTLGGGTHLHHIDGVTTVNLP